jgi:hypothetical protein
LDKVIVENSAGVSWFFPCGSWLSSTEGDKVTSREIPASASDSVTYSPFITYKVTVITGDRSGAGTDANVSIEIFGDKGKSGKQLLDNASDNFERGKSDVFGIETVDLGKVQKIVIGHDNKGFGAAWFLEKVILTNMKDNTTDYFLCGDWLEGAKSQREILASDKDGVASTPLVVYKIEIVTGTKFLGICELITFR